MPIDTNPTIVLRDSDSESLVFQCSCGKIFVFDDDDYPSDVGTVIARHIKKCHVESEASHDVDSGM